PWNHRLALGPIGATGGQAANHFARDADLVIAVGTRLGDFTTMSKTAFANPDVRFVAINVCDMDAAKHAAIAVIADARVAVQEGFKLIIVLCDSEGYASIGALSRSVGSGGFGTEYRYRDQATGSLTGKPLPVDLAANAASLGAIVHRVSDRASLAASLAAAR